MLSEKEMGKGYLDGIQENSPEPGNNRTHCYIHGFQLGRSDLTGQLHESGEELRERSHNAIINDQLK